MNTLSKKNIQWLSALIVAVSISGPWSTAKAQQINPIPITSNLYLAKFVCGFQDGQTPPQLNRGLGGGIPLPNQSAPVFRGFQPGSYSTTLNLFNTSSGTARFSVFASIDGVATTPNVATVSLGTFRSRQIGCDEIAGRVAPLIPGGLINGDLVEGFLYIQRTRKDLDAQVVYSYSSIDAFHEFRGDDGLVAGTGAAGAGGLGLGASIDVERITPLETASPFILVPNKIFP